MLVKLIIEHSRDVMEKIVDVEPENGKNPRRIAVRKFKSDMQSNGAKFHGLAYELDGKLYHIVRAELLEN